jgi:uncharacterized low-complexity protein
VKLIQLNVNLDQTINQGAKMMKRIMTNGALALVLALGVASPAVLAKGKKVKPSAEHVAAVKKCKADYSEAVKAAKGKKGKDRKDAMAAAKTAENECIANAPK